MDQGDDDSDYSDRDFDRSRRRKKRLGYKDHKEDTDLNDSPPQNVNPSKHPIILVKPGSEWPAPSRTPEAASPSRPGGSPMIASPAVMVRQRDDRSTSTPAQAIPSMLAGEGQLPQAPHYMIQRNPTAAAVSTHPEGGAQGKLSCPPELSHAIKLVDDTMSWCDSAMDVLLDQTDFLTVGVLGLQSTGKSTVLSMLAGSKPTHSQKSFLFRPQSREIREVGGHQTNGLDMYVTSERVIVIDSQPMLSASLIDLMVHNDKKYPPDYNSVENYIEMQSLQIATFMMTVCHVVIVVVDWFVDLNLLRFLQTAEMLKPAKPTSSHEGQVLEDGQEYYPHVVFVLNKARREDFSQESQRTMKNLISQVMGQSKLKYKGNINSNGNTSPKHKSLHSNVNLVLLPSAEDSITENESKMEYKGYPSFERQIINLRNDIFSIPRTPLTHTTLSEKNWFHYAARTWDAVKKSQLLSEYNRLLP